MDQKIDLNTGGVAVVLVGHSGLVKEYQNNPSIKFIIAKDVKEGDLEKDVPSNTKVIILTDGTTRYCETWSFSYARRKNIPYLVRHTNQQVYELLKSFFPNSKENKITQEEAVESIRKGKLKLLVPWIDFTKSNTQNADILLVKANELNIKTTKGSLEQLVSIQRRKLNGQAVIKSLRPKLDLSVELLDNMIKELTDMREFIIATTEENRVLKNKLDKFKKAMED